MSLEGPIEPFYCFHYLDMCVFQGNRLSILVATWMKGKVLDVLLSMQMNKGTGKFPKGCFPLEIRNDAKQQNYQILESKIKISAAQGKT